MDARGLTAVEAPGQTPAPHWRLLVTEPADGATNMAVDEALWRSRRDGGPPTVRFYAWDPPTVSLGYAQPLDGAVDAAACRALGVGLVRRPTGGSAIYHDGPARELTYSVAASIEDLGVAANLLASYRWIGEALVAGLRDLGAPAELVNARGDDAPAPAFCFARTGRWEIEYQGRKLVGSAQRRQGKTFVQHGSVLLGVDRARLSALFPTTPDPAATLATLEDALGVRPGFDAVVKALAGAFERCHGLQLAPGGLTPTEVGLVDELVAAKYGSAAWLTGVA